MLQSLSILTGNDGSPRGIQQVHTSQISQLSTNSDPSRAVIIEFERKNDHELPLLSFSCVVAATDNFSVWNKLGESGFGPVFKVCYQATNCPMRFSYNIDKKFRCQQL